MTSLPSPVQSVLELFQGPLASVRFADIDAAGLSELAAAVEAAAAEVEVRENELSELRQALAQRQEALLLLAQQALAYARVYAENDEPLLEAVNRISLPRAAKPRKATGVKAPASRGDLAGEPSAPPAGEEAASAAEAEPALADADSSTSADAESDSPSVPSAAQGRAVRKGRGTASQRAAN